MSPAGAGGPRQRPSGRPFPSPATPRRTTGDFRRARETGILRPGRKDLTVGAKTTLFMLWPKALGDVVLNLPAAELLIDAGFDLCVGAPHYARDLLPQLPCTFFDAADRAELRRRVRESNHCSALVMRSSFRSALAIRRIGLPVIGFRGQCRTFLLWKALPRPRGLLKVDEYYRLAQFASTVCRGGPAPTTWQSPPFPRLTPTDRHARRGLELLESAGVAQPFVVCCATAAPRYRQGWKLWNGFPEFVERLRASGLQVVTCPGRAEEELCARMAPGCRMIEGVDVASYAAIIERADAVVSNDTGPMHLAAAVGAPTLGIFGDTSPVRHAPWGEKATHVGELGRWPSVDEAWEAFRNLPRD